MDITFNCGSCGQHIVVDEAGAGMTVQCPKCQAQLVVPQTQPAPSKPPSPPAAVPPVISEPTPTFRCQCGQHIVVDEAATEMPVTCPKCRRFLPGILFREGEHAAHNKAQIALAKMMARAAHDEWLANQAMNRPSAATLAHEAHDEWLAKERAESEWLAKEQGESELGRNRRISKEVQRAVWRRDMGKCVQCGSQENLEFDHVIPVSEGGSSTERNVQLLCEKCNRRKAAKIG